MTIHLTGRRRWQAARLLLGLAQIVGTLGLLTAGAALYTTAHWSRQHPPQLSLFVAALAMFVIAFTAETTGTQLRNRARADRPTFYR